ncbi:unnamed protein product [Linum trigynum]|uniref:Uncharacterized protein n=1 Tax=Linum trigynum TaxID=586398 RepID=A0AAV2G5H7_9ROSI
MGHRVGCCCSKLAFPCDVHLDIAEALGEWGLISTTTLNLDDYMSVDSLARFLVTVALLAISPTSLKQGDPMQILTCFVILFSVSSFFAIYEIV